jgi:hypothetical protein
VLLRFAFNKILDHKDKLIQLKVKSDALNVVEVLKVESGFGDLGFWILDLKSF